MKIIEAVEKIDSFGDLPENWDSYKAERITQVAIDKAKEIVQAVDKEVHFVAPVSGGGVQIEYQVKDNYYEIEVYPDGERSQFIRIENIELEVDMPSIQEITESIKKLYCKE